MCEPNELCVIARKFDIDKCTDIMVVSSMQKAGIGTRGTGTCAPGTVGLGHAILGHFFDTCL